MKTIGGMKMMIPITIWLEAQRMMKVKLNGLKQHLCTRRVTFTIFLLIGLDVAMELIQLMRFIWDAQMYELVHMWIKMVYKCKIDYRKNICIYRIS